MHLNFLVIFYESPLCKELRLVRIFFQRTIPPYLAKFTQFFIFGLIRNDAFSALLIIKV